MKYCLRLLIAIAFFSLLASPIFAVSVTVTDMPSTVSATPFTVTVSVYGANSGKNYLRVDLFKDGTFNYFGETFNGSEWYFGSIGTSYFPIDIIASTSTASATFQAQIGEPTSSEYLGPGAYKLRIRRYTSSSSYSSSDSYNVSIDIPTPTPTVTPTPIPAVTPTPTFTSTPTKTPTPTPIKPTNTPTPTKSIVTPSATLAGEVLSASAGSAVITPVVLSDTAKNLRPLIMGFLLVGLGLGLLAFGLVWKRWKNLRSGKEPDSPGS